jgi:hypothetical protein
MDCERTFIARYSRTAGESLLALLEALPATVETAGFSDTINEISPDFVSINQQAQQAEQYSLLLICGPGYRKSLEFLIKDYVIKAHPDKAEQIKKLLLGNCIKEYVTDGRIKGVAERAVWLGNDETHYLRKWEGKDLQDLKRLISLTVHWIEMEELTKAAMDDMPEDKK